MNLFLVRHGMVSWNQLDGKNRTQDPDLEWIREKGGTPLLPQGKQQAILTGKKLASVKFDAILVSPLIRAVMTAAEIARQQENKTYLEILPELQEARSPGCYKFSKEDMEKVWPYIIYPESMEDTCWSGNSSDGDQALFEYRRAERVLEKIKNRFRENENVLIVSHGMFIEENLFPVIFRIPLENRSYYHFYVSNCGISKIEFRPSGEIAVATLNETTQLGELSTDKIF